MKFVFELPKENMRHESQDFNMAVVHDWFPTFAGGENVVECIIKEFQVQNLYTLFCRLNKEEMNRLNPATLHTSRLNTLPWIRNYYRILVEDCMLAVELFDLSDYDVVLSSTVAFSKGVLTGPSQMHVSYIHSPPRYAWDMTHQYFKKSGLLAPVMNELLHRKLHKLRIWDLRTINALDKIIVNSHFIANRVRKFYRRNATVIYPPVDVENFTLGSEKDDYYVTASRMVPYKRVDLIVSAFSQMPEKKLVVIGDGPEASRIKAIAGPNTEFLGHVPRQTLIEKLQNAQAYIYAALEDFGIAPVEAQACGTPVIGYAAGGILETVKSIPNSNPTGIYFGKQEVGSIISAVERYEKSVDQFHPELIRQHAETFSAQRFRNQIRMFIEQSWADFQKA